MKRVNFVSIVIASLCLVSLSFLSCDNDNDIPQEEPSNPTEDVKYKRVVEKIIEGDEITYFEYDDKWRIIKRTRTYDDRKFEYRFEYIDDTIIEYDGNDDKTVYYLNEDGYVYLCEFYYEDKCTDYYRFYYDNDGYLTKILGDDNSIKNSFSWSKGNLELITGGYNDCTLVYDSVLNNLTNIDFTFYNDFAANEPLDALLEGAELAGCGDYLGKRSKNVLLIEYYKRYDQQQWPDDTTPDRIYKYDKEGYPIEVEAHGNVYQIVYRDVK